MTIASAMRTPMTILATSLTDLTPPWLRRSRRTRYQNNRATVVGNAHRQAVAVSAALPGSPIAVLPSSSSLGKEAAMTYDPDDYDEVYETRSEPEKTRLLGNGWVLLDERFPEASGRQLESFFEEAAETGGLFRVTLPPGDYSLATPRTSSDPSGRPCGPAPTRGWSSDSRASEHSGPTDGRERRAAGPTTWWPVPPRHREARPVRAEPAQYGK